jgi:hypothetical protein
MFEQNAFTTILNKDLGQISYLTLLLVRFLIYKDIWGFFRYCWVQICKENFYFEFYYIEMNFQNVDPCVKEVF